MKWIGAGIFTEHLQAPACLRADLPSVDGDVPARPRLRSAHLPYAGSRRRPRLQSRARLPSSKAFVLSMTAAAVEAAREAANLSCGLHDIIWPQDMHADELNGNLGRT